MPARKDWARAFQLAAPGRDRKALYTKYINSSAWNQSTARLACIERAQGRCEVCGRKGKHVHHITYQRIGAELPTDLQYVCLVCHEGLHTKWK
jgi:5-methylcytosine-specific restriction endonuclease McrA